MDSLLTLTTVIAFAATIALAFVLPRLRAGERRHSYIPKGRKRPVKSYAPPPRPEKLKVAASDPDWNACVAVSQHIADLMIADEWLEIADTIAKWESELRSTPGGERFHELATRTCLSGLHGLIEDAPRTSLDDLSDAETEVGHFIDSHRQMPDDYILALLAARAHMAIGDAYGDDVWPDDLRHDALRRMAKHYIAAGHILDGFDPVAFMSPLLGEAHYLQGVGTPGGDDALEDLFNDWIFLDPSNPRVYDTHVAALVERDLIEGEDVLREAEAAMRRTEETLGFGGYALFFMPLLSEYDTARSLLDPELYAAALMDLASHSATQAEINHAAATLLTEVEASEETTATALRDTLLLLVRQHLREIHPRVWPISVEEIQDLADEAKDLLPELSEIHEFEPTADDAKLSAAA